MKTLNVNSILKSSKLQYKIEKVLGQGSFGITYLASTTIKVEGPLGSIETPIKVAIKEFFMRDINGREEGTVTCSNQNGLYDRYKEKFIKETQNLSKLKHRHIIKVLEVFEANNTYYYVMEFCEGGSLDDEIAKRGNLTEEETKRYARQIADALSYMHDNKMLHLDLKPGNAMLRGDGDVVLIDFGLSKQYDENGQPESSTTIGGGTPGYAPLEQSNYDGKGFPKTMDIYALGGTMFKMLTGKRPPEASIILNYGFPTDELRQQGVSEQMIGCIERSMSFRVADRPQSIADFLKLLDGEGVKTQDDDEATEIVGVERPKPADPKREEPKQELPNEQKPKKKKSKAWIFILLAIIIGGAGYYFVNDKMKGEKKKEAKYNGHEYVDLGLSVKWATCNVGANKPEDYGNYYAWGETSTKSSYTGDNSKTYGKQMNDIKGNSQYDAARANWGGTWRLPTKAELEELKNKCTWRWTTQNSVKGYKVTGPNGNSIFLPAAGYRGGSSLYTAGERGYFWSSTPYEGYSNRAYSLYFYSGYQDVNWDLRDYGRSVRPVSDEDDIYIVSVNNETFTVNGVSFTMIKVEGGTFQMGAQSIDPSGTNYDSDASSNEKPVHSVTLSDYYIGETEVTQELWEAVMGSNPSKFKGSQKPVEEVSWNDCKEFIAKLNRLTGKNFRLPTEAEWEYAARGGNKSKGYKYSGSNTIDYVAWYGDNSETYNVKTKSPNELGIYDMSSNVGEWCEDRYGYYSSGSQTNPAGPSSGSCRVLRGGSWDSHAKYCRVSLRYGSNPSSKFNYFGFRLALSQ